MFSPVMNRLEIDNIRLNFGKQEILKGIYFKAKKGKVTGILGSNGSGKTSLLRIIFGELKPQNKLLRIDDKPIRKPLYGTKQVHYLPQFHFIPPNLSIERVFFFFNIQVLPEPLQ